MAIATIDIFNLVYQQLLRIPTEVVSRYPTVQDQLLYLILIPHVLLLLFIYAFSTGVVGKILGQEKHIGFRNLIAIVAYLYIIFAGWYGLYLVAWMNNLLMVALMFGFLLFFSTFIVHPARWPGIAEQTTKIASEAGKKVFEKGSDKKAAKERIKEIDKELRINNDNMLMAHDKTVFLIQKNMLESEKAKLKLSLRKGW